MAWDFIYVTRDGFQDGNPWGNFYLRNESGCLDWLCYSYELPWKTNGAGKSLVNKSRIKIGNYEVKPRADGSKGWRLELQGTGHRENIQIHRAHPSLYIEGCILPVHVNDFFFGSSGVKRNDKVIQTESVSLMTKIKNRYAILNPKMAGSAKVVISAQLPINISLDRDHRYV